ncbi:hypothetical protein OOU_Y34scaffold00783g2 [Pyricularia oryzae Y34]|uniref:Uncharacterized protein n=1 Tax=Pyricularia oryzae (strain Y34) TaxID=1143189 RepID=A0AA97NQ41_PYRO3|nr:hypothetical protein OOU_Y34scaffold00783g2 [Pyricularia oryzae Y34]
MVRLRRRRRGGMLAINGRTHEIVAYYLPGASSEISLEVLIGRILRRHEPESVGAGGGDGGQKGGRELHFDVFLLDWRLCCEAVERSK